MDSSQDAPRSPLASAWDEAAAAYESYFAQRFSSWHARAASALTEECQLPCGPLLVPCCGPGFEVAYLARAQPAHTVIGIDFSHTMVSLTRRRCATLPNVSADCLDAALLHRRWDRQAAGVLSCFGLQQLPDPEHSIGSWFETLAPGGVLSVLYWPRRSEATGPFATLWELFAERISLPDVCWEGQLSKRLASSGAEILLDEKIRYPMHHPSAEAAWQAIASSGHMRTLALQHGAHFVDEMGRAFCSRLPPGPIEHHPSAHWIVARRGP